MEQITPVTQRRRILFLISLPQTSEFEQDREDIEECLNELREQHVDVREHISYEDLAEANNYDIVIVVAHRDVTNDALILADGTMKMSDFVNSLPSDFKGIIDFSSCYSATAFQAIKDRCPQSRVQVAIVEIALLQRLIIYPSLVAYLNEDLEIDYHEAYKELATAFDEIVETENIGSDVPNMSSLGQKMSSIYAPSEVMRDSVFQIMVFFHYDSEKEVVRLKAHGWQTNSIIREELEIPINLKENDNISITLSFDSTDNEHLKETDNEYTKIVTIKEDLVVEKFGVIVMPDFRGNSFQVNVEMAKDDIPFIKPNFIILIADKINKAPAEVVADLLQYPTDAEEQITCYSDIFTNRLFGSDNYARFLKSLPRNAPAENRVYIIRKFIYDNELFVTRLDAFLQDKDKKLSELSRGDVNRTEIATDLVPLLKSFGFKLQKKLESLEYKFMAIRKVGDRNINFVDAIQKFQKKIEWNFIDLCSEIKNFDYQISMLKTFKELRDVCKKKDIDKNNVKELVTQFLELPHQEDVDKELFDIFKSSGTGSMIHSRSKGATSPFLALVLAMVEGEYTSIDNGKENWTINVVDKYMDFSENEGSLRTPKNRINKLVSLLGRTDIRESIKNYQKKPEAGKISITAYYLLRVKISIS